MTSVTHVVNLPEQDISWENHTYMNALRLSQIFTKFFDSWAHLDQIPSLYRKVLIDIHYESINARM